MSRASLIAASALVLSYACSSEGGGPDAGQPDGTLCPLPEAECSAGVLDVWPVEELPAPGSRLTVTSIEAGEGDAVDVAFDGVVIRLPAAPALSVGDEVLFEDERGGTVLRLEGEWVAFVAATPLGETEAEANQIREALTNAFEVDQPVPLDVLGIAVTATRDCGGWRGHVGFNNGCSDIPMLGFAVRTGGVIVPPGAVGRFDAPDGSEVVFHNRGIAVPVAFGDGACIRCADWVTASCGRCASVDPHATRFAMVRRLEP